MPLPAHAGAAIADYCRNARPRAAASGMLFLHARAPYGPLSSSAVGDLGGPGLSAGPGRRLPVPSSAPARRRDRDAAGRGAPVRDRPVAPRHQHEGTTSKYGTIDPDEVLPLAMSPVAGGSVMTVGSRGQVRDYLALRRAMGFKMEKYWLPLDSLARHLEAAGQATVTVQAAAEWAMLPQDAHPNRWKQRLDAARGFARDLAGVRPGSRDPAARAAGRTPEPAPALHLHRAGDRRAAQGSRAAPLAPTGGHLSRPVRPDRRAAGCRRGEAVRLDDADVDLDEAMITIRDSKFGKSRRIPVDATATAALRDYLGKRRACPGRRRRRRCSCPPTGPGSSPTTPTPSSRRITATGIGS